MDNSGDDDTSPAPSEQLQCGRLRWDQQGERYRAGSNVRAKNTLVAASPEDPEALSVEALFDEMNAPWQRDVMKEARKVARSVYRREGIPEGEPVWARFKEEGAWQPLTPALTEMATERGGSFVREHRLWFEFGHPEGSPAWAAGEVLETIFHLEAARHRHLSLCGGVAQQKAGHQLENRSLGEMFGASVWPSRDVSIEGTLNALIRYAFDLGSDYEILLSKVLPQDGKGRTVEKLVEGRLAQGVELTKGRNLAHTNRRAKSDPLRKAASAVIATNQNISLTACARQIAGDKDDSQVRKAIKSLFYFNLRLKEFRPKRDL